ncbi:MAG: amino acid ABC transporter substrate-binding protein [Cyanobacteria bacterium]|nr:amino acid ABC transporter substrate-binding protein [Cyanobacteria bacterium CG_2015-16_32_12]NCO77982.1 amino acid ABC transporter substrate-binding protein [Cyanobacteria bacterium CG_2015-22_32_23]NCQ04447.1 amino acid ABC transporter substrate-binding protein [Cyanobacteria bacterium CG_2015-09_32_10]NCQ40704.1 amino acid ABC transporter substrate-binding protein [Cyanobacteria bacterium CG_2015-04_32_10]NCS85297.1 amino acid ABC transporter substrate-binding protein [Cyanobacteria bact
MIKFKIIDQLISITISTILMLFIPFNVNAENESILEEVNRTGLLKVGIRSDAIPFGYRNNNGELQGICFDLVALIREKLSQKIDRNIITVTVVISSLQNRFSIVEDKVVHLECGPNTIRALDDDKVIFSDVFFISGIQFITRQDNASKFLNSDGKNLTIGLLLFTNTETLIKEKYPQAQFQLFQGIKGTQRALQALRQGRIDGFANDGILLIGESLAQQILIGNNQEYVLIPQPPFTCEKYGLILPNNDPNWENFVNSVLNSQEKKQVINNWFNTINNDSLSNQENCN